MHSMIKFEITDDSDITTAEFIFEVSKSEGKYKINYHFGMGETTVINVFEGDRIQVAKQFRLMADFLEDK